MPVEKEKPLESGKEYQFSADGVVQYQGVDGFGMAVFKPVKGKFSGENITLTKHQTRLLIRELPVKKD